jgi:hypothetical protein
MVSGAPGPAGTDQLEELGLAVTDVEEDAE